MKVTLTVEVEVEDDMGWTTGQEVADTLEEVIEEAIPAGLHVTVTVQDED